MGSSTPAVTQPGQRRSRQQEQPGRCHHEPSLLRLRRLITSSCQWPTGVVTVKFTQNTVEGLSTHTINSIRANKAAKTLSMEIYVPKATARGLYHMQGVLGPLELDESLAPAPYTTSFTGTTVSGVAKMDVVNGKLKIVQDPDVTINVEGLNVQMENLFGGEADGLAKVVLRFVNKESDKFIKDFQPEIAKQVSNLIKTFFNSALDNIPVNTFE